jgi:hypothetical protein
MTVVEQISTKLRSQLQAELPNQPESQRESIIQWLLGDDRDRLETLSPEQQQIANQAIDYRYRILRQRYLSASPERAYKGLIQRLSNLFLIRNKIRTWIALSRDRHRTVVDVLQEIIQELLQNDTYMQQQMAWISQCTEDRRLRNALLLASTEEYCLRPIRNQPLLCYRFVNYLRRSQKAGMTQVPVREFIRLVSDEIAPEDSESSSVSLLDTQAIAQFQDDQTTLEQQELRQIVQRQFEAYLAEKVGPEAAQWLQLYLQGRSQESIAKTLNRPINDIYRLREKISYHAVRVFALKNQSELVTSWLGASPSRTSKAPVDRPSL